MVGFATEVSTRPRCCHFRSPCLVMLSISHCVLITAVLALAYVVGASRKSTDPVTCGSVIKLQHKETGNNLHSHGIAWGSGSGQQSVTTNSVKNDRGSLWLVKEGHNAEQCTIGKPVACGDVIRLEHVETHKNLHSHLFKAPLSGNQEVSGFGDESGNGDTGDNWQIVCDSSSDALWYRSKPVVLKHADTGKFLTTSSSAMFNQHNCGGQCPIMSQTEVSASPKKDVRAKWATAQGVYFPQHVNDEDLDDEL